MQTERLILREWKDSDLPVFAELNADPQVMEYFPKRLSREESDARAASICEHFERHGFGLWAIEVRDEASFIGFTGLNVPQFTTDFTPCVEVGWRLHRDYWGRGFATEAAQAAIQFGFEQLGLNEILSYTVPANLRSRRVMERLGMTHDPSGDFDHPLLPESHPLRRHVLYRLRRKAP
jgi:RimJ/RimL family protein N-acetyltransferase